MSITKYTPTFRLAKPNFEDSVWHDFVNGNMDKIDSLLGASIAIVGLQGLWQQSTAYLVGDRVVDTDTTIWSAEVAHTSAGTGNMAADRAAHPTYWVQISNGYTIRGDWDPATYYQVGDFVQDVTEHVAALCIVEHTSTTNIRTDAAKWLYAYDIKDEYNAVIANATSAATSAQDAQVAKMEWQGPWVSATVYELNDVVSNAGNSYICVIAHTSGTFATDLAAGRWEIVARAGLSGSGSGDMDAAVYDPQGIGADAFAMANMIESATHKVMSGTERTKLSGIATGAQVNPTNAAIKTAYEANADTNAFTDAFQAKLTGIETGADITDGTNVGIAINLSSVATIADGDKTPFYDISSTSLRHHLWSTIKAALKTYFDTIYSAVSHVHTFAAITSKPTTLSGYGITDAVAETINVVAGTGLTGGGALSANVTLNMGTPQSITGVSTNTSGADTHSHALSLSSADITDILGYVPAAAPSTSTLPVGSVILGCNIGATDIANNATIAGSSLGRVTQHGASNYSGGGGGNQPTQGLRPGPACTGTWKNIQGATVDYYTKPRTGNIDDGYVYYSTYGLFVRTA